MDHTPTNFEVADVFEQIAQILEGRGENPFKIRAYRNAVRTLENLTEPVAAIGARGELKKINGFGDAIAGKTQEILATGTCELLERRKRRMPSRPIAKKTRRRKKATKKKAKRRRSSRRGDAAADRVLFAGHARSREEAARTAFGADIAGRRNAVGRDCRDGSVS